MKKLFLGLCLLSLFSSCSKEITIEGVWKVVHYIDSGKDETSNFTGYSFDFQTGGTLVAKLPSGTKTGTWNENSSSKKLSIKISGEAKLDKISDDWIIVEKTASSMRFKDDNASSDEELHLTKL
jgi:hypothetical protein